MSVEILQPKPFDLVDATILIAGNAAGFEGHLSVSVTDGHYEVRGSATTSSSAVCQFQTSIELPADAEFTLNRLFVTVADDSGGEDGVPVPSHTVPVLYGSMILDSYTGFWTHEVAPGETLSQLAQRYYDNASMYPAIHQANQHIVLDPNMIFPGQRLRIPRSY